MSITTQQLPDNLITNNYVWSAWVALKEQQGVAWIVEGLAAGFISVGFVVRGTDAPAVSPGPRGGIWTTCKGKQSGHCDWVI